MKRTLLGLAIVGALLLLAPNGSAVAQDKPSEASSPRRNHGARCPNPTPLDGHPTGA